MLKLNNSPNQNRFKKKSGLYSLTCCKKKIFTDLKKKKKKKKKKVDAKILKNFSSFNRQSYFLINCLMACPQ